MLFQQLKSSDGIEIEEDGVHVPTGQLRDKSHDPSQIDTPSIAVDNYDHYTSIQNEQTIDSMIDSCFISSLFLPGNAFSNTIPIVAIHSLYWQSFN